MQSSSSWSTIALFGLLIAVQFQISIAGPGLRFRGQETQPWMGGKPYIVKLQRESAPGLHGNAPKGFYLANLIIGGGPAGPGKTKHRQKLRISFDLTSGQVVVPSSHCRGLGCLRHRRYDPSKSHTAVDIDSDSRPLKAGAVDRDTVEIEMHSVDIGATGTIKGELVREQLCLSAEAGDLHCSRVGMVAATHMTGLPFRMIPNDGIIGLGLDDFTISQKFSFLRSLGAGSNGIRSLQFGLYLGSDGEDSGEIAFGGYDSKRVNSPLVWTPVVRPKDGLWQVEILAVRLGNVTLDLCPQEGVFGCRGAFDMGASGVSLASSLASDLEEQLEDSVLAAGSGHGPELQLVLDSDVITVPAQDYFTVMGSTSISPLVTRHYLPEPFGQNLFILGESVLRRYYTVFDLEAERVGLSLASQAKDPETTPEPGSSSAPPKILVLLQVTVRKSTTVV